MMISIPELLYINWYETGHVSSLTINELETVKFYSDGTLASYEKRGIPNVQYSWDALGEPVGIFYYANFYPQWEAPLQRTKIDSIKARINKQDWMTGLPEKFNPESFRLNHFENGSIKIAANFSDTPAANYITIYDISGQLFKVAADTSDRRSQTCIDYLNKYNAKYQSLLSDPKLDSIWKAYGYNSKKSDQQEDLIEILLNNPQQYVTLQIKEHAYAVIDEEYSTETHPLQYLSIYETNAPGIDTRKLNAVLKEKPYPSDNKLFLQNVIEKLKQHSTLVIHKNPEECYECEDTYPPSAKTYAFSDLSYNMNQLNYRLTDLTIKPITLLGNHLVIEYEYHYTIHTNESSAKISMKKFYLLDLKTNSIASSASLITPAKKKDFELYLHEKLKRLNLDSLQQKSVLKEITLLPRLQSFDLLIPADYHICNDDNIIMDEDIYLNIDLHEIKPFLDLKHPLTQWMLMLPKEQTSVFNRNQDIFEKEDLKDLLMNSISSRLFKNVHADTITISNNIQLLYQYAFNKNKQLVYKESTNEYREKTYFQYATTGKLHKANKVITKYENENPEISSTDWYFDNNGNLKAIIDSSVYGCEPKASGTYYYNWPDYTYIDKKTQNEKYFYKHGVKIGSLNETMQINYIHDTTFIKKIVSSTSTSILIEGYYYTYDQSGNLIRIQDQMGFSVYEFRYDATGQVQSCTHSTRSVDMNYFVNKIIQYQYDSIKKLKSILIKYQSEFSTYEDLYTVQYQ